MNIGKVHKAVFTCKKMLDRAIILVVKDNVSCFKSHMEATDNS